MDAAPMDSTVESPRTTARTGHLRTGLRFPSTSTSSGAGSSLLHRFAHRLHRRLEDVDRVDDVRVDARHGTAYRALPDLEIQLGPASRRESLGVPESHDPNGRVENHCRRDHGPGKRSPAGFVDAGDEPEPPAPATTPPAPLEAFTL